MEELVHVRLDSRVDRLTVEDKVLTEGQGGVAWILTVLQETEDVLDFPDNVFLVINLFCI